MKDLFNLNEQTEPKIAKAKKTRREFNAISRRAFAAGKSDRLLSGWKVDAGFTPAEINANLSSVRGHSREMEKDSELFKRWLQLFKVNVVGEGFSLRSMPHDDHNGTLVLDKEASKLLEYNWKRFCTWRDPVTQLTWFDATGRKTEAEMDRLNAKTWARDGEYFMMVQRTPLNPYGISFRVLRPDWCDHTYNISHTGRGTTILNGVEINTNSRSPVAYWFSSPPDSATAYNGGRPLVSIPATQIIHGFTQEDEEQTRGIPRGHASIRKLKMIDSYDESEITAARDESCATRTYYAPRGDEDAFNDLTNASDRVALEADKEPGQSEILPDGWRSEVIQPKHPNKELTGFKASMTKNVASGFGIEYSNFANDWAGVSYSSVRGGTISERDCWTVEQNDFIAQSKNIQYRLWVKSFLEFSISGSLPMAKYEKFIEHEFKGRRWMWIDPVRDVKAAEIAVDRGWKTNTDVAADMDEDYGNNLEVIERENADKAGENDESVPVLNGAQIAAAMEVVQNYAAGSIGDVAAIALLTAAGVPVESANNMINNQAVNKLTEVITNEKKEE